ncbi:choice-of-anchor A family protein [Oscillibacter sp.]|uniref:choice-of-anchor A family protein n=1 Tax=Oscillibacter sp. TaxID=1945593 RepID=UPI002898FE80|nr:choice-of-anchor A family protein [Oscillibacter sp.]
MFCTLSILSFLVAMSTFRLLTLPAVTLTEDPNTMETSKNSASSEEALPGEDAENTDEATGTGDVASGTEPEGNTPGTEPGTNEGDTLGTEPGINEGNTPGTETGTNEEDTPGTETGTNEGDTPGTEPGTNEGNTPGTEPGTNEGNTPGTEPGTGEGDTPGTEPDTPGAEPIPGAEAEKNTNPGIPLDSLIKAPEIIQPSEYTYDDGNGLTVTAVPQDPDSIPMDAEFHAGRITQESAPDRYAQLQQLLVEEGGLVSSTGFSAYDIYFLLDGLKVEPDGSEVGVTIVDTTDSAVAPEEAQVFHVLNENSDPSLQKLAVEKTAGSSADMSDADQGITFTTDSFSTFAVAPKLPVSSTLTYKRVPSDAPVFTDSEYNVGRPLGIAGHFSLVAFDTLYISADCNGNILAQTLSKVGDFGTKGLSPLSEVSYVQNYPNLNANGPRDNELLVLGSDNAVDTTDGGTHFTVKGHKLSNATALWQDYDTSSTPFIDLQAVKSEAEGLSYSLSAILDQNIRVSLVNSGDQTKSGVTLTDPGGVGVYNTTANALSAYNYCNVRGLTFNGSALSDGTMIINVDCTGWNSRTFNMPECKIYSESGNALNFQEVTTFTNGRVLWNFTNCNGMTISTRLEYCSILAPGANIIVNHNINGTVIGNNVTIKAENHRDDFVGKLPKSCDYTVNKVWKDLNGNVLTTGDLTDWSVEVELRDQGDNLVDKQILSNSNNWRYTWSDLDQNKTYTVVEIGVYQNGNPTNLIGQFTPTSVDSGGSCTITNSKTNFYELPDTGGSGTYLYTATGLSFLLLSSILLWKKKKKRRNAA